MTDLPSPAPAGPGVKGEVTTLELERHERAIARRSAEARATVPSVEYATVAELPPSRAAELAGGITAGLVGAVARALRAEPRVNGAYRDGRYELYSRVNVGVSYARDGTYVIPTLFDADRKSPAELESELGELFARAASAALSPAELTGATFTLSASGPAEVATMTPVILPPQAAALAAGPVRAAPVIRDGAVEAGHTMSLALACDNRIVFGAIAEAFLAAVRAELEGTGG